MLQRKGSYGPKREQRLLRETSRTRPKGLFHGTNWDTAEQGLDKLGYLAGDYGATEFGHEDRRNDLGHAPRDALECNGAAG